MYFSPEKLPPPSSGALVGFMQEIDTGVLIRWVMPLSASRCASSFAFSAPASRPRSRRASAPM